MLRAFKYRLFPNKQQQRLLERQLDECRWLYNHLLAARRDAWEQRQETLRYYDQATRLPALKAERPALAEVNAQALQNVAVRIDLAFKAFFRRVKAGEKPGYPRFKGSGRYDSFTFPQSGFSITHDQRVCLSKIGRVKMVYHRPVKGKIKTCTIERSRTGEWYVCFSCEMEPERLPQNTNRCAGKRVCFQRG